MPVKILPRPTPKPDPKPDPQPKPKPDPKPTLGAPTGTIPRGKIAGGGPWAKVNRYDPSFVKHGRANGVDPAMLKSMMIVETGGENVTDPHGAGGEMQIKDEFWGEAARKAGYNLRIADGQVGMAAAMLGGKIPGVVGKDPRERFLYTYYPVLDRNGNICLDCRGESGHTPRMYLDDIALYTGLINAAAGKDTPKPKPAPTQADVIRLITNGAPGAYISFGFNELNTLTTEAIYKYGAGHGLPAGGRYHPGVDIWTPDETPISAVFGGEVTCVGEQGREIWGQGCGYFVDDQHGVGNLTILTDTEVTISGKRYRLKMTYGHMSSATVKLGDRVKAGQVIGRSGVGFKWPHVHLDVVVEAPALNNPQIWFNGGAYHLVDPMPTIISAIGGDVVGGEAPPELMAFTYLESPNHMSRQGRPILAIVHHIADSMSLEGTLSWLRQRGSDASSHWVVDRDGTPYQLVGSSEAAFTNGPLLNPRQDIPWLRDLPRGDNPNWYTLTIESIGTPATGITPEQVATIVQIDRYYLAKYPTIQRNRGGLNRHSDIASVKNPPFAPDPTGKIDRSYCPGDKYPLREIILAVGGDPDRMAA